MTKILWQSDDVNFTAATLAEFYGTLAANPGSVAQNWWHDMANNGKWPDLHSTPKCWRIVEPEPKPKLVDYSPLAGSPVVFDFWDGDTDTSIGDQGTTAFLWKALEGWYADGAGRVWSHCAPVLGMWFAPRSIGEGITIPEGLDYMVRYESGGSVFETPASRTPAPIRVHAYCIIGPLPGYTLT
jgi:hypothetical protein